MFCEKYFVLVILVACAAAVVSAKPSGIKLSIVKDLSICRTVVDYDEAEDRIPRLIKVLKCAPNPYMMCPARSPGGDSEPCCGHTAPDGPQLTCTEVLDEVVVSNAKGEIYTINVPVGCACIQQDSNEARELK